MELFETDRECIRAGWEDTQARAEGSPMEPWPIPVQATGIGPVADTSIVRSAIAVKNESAVSTAISED
jgi:hypothetical protein